MAVGASRQRHEERHRLVESFVWSRHKQAIGDRTEHRQQRTDHVAKGQTFPGAGTVTSVGSGAGLTGGPITGSGSLSIASGGVSNAMLANPSLTVTAGTDLTGGGLVSLGGSTTLNVDTTKVVTAVNAGTDLTGGGTGGSLTLNVDTGKVPQLAAANTFTNVNAISVNNGSTAALTLSNAGGDGGLNVNSSSSGYGIFVNGNGGQLGIE